MLNCISIVKGVNMKAYVVHKDGKRGIEDIPVALNDYGEYEALVKMLSCGVCNGTDMKIIHSQFKGIDEYPVVLGHEGVGEVVEVGSKVRHLKKSETATENTAHNPPLFSFFLWIFLKSMVYCL